MEYEAGVRFGNSAPTAVAAYSWVEKDERGRLEAWTQSHRMAISYKRATPSRFPGCSSSRRLSDTERANPRKAQVQRFQICHPSHLDVQFVLKHSSLLSPPQADPFNIQAARSAAAKTRTLRGQRSPPSSSLKKHLQEKQTAIGYHAFF
eukprot:6182833-Pleurochrysis_carterae.AAC.3